MLKGGWYIWKKRKSEMPEGMERLLKEKMVLSYIERVPDTIPMARGNTYQWWEIPKRYVLNV